MNQDNSFVGTLGTETCEACGQWQWLVRLTLQDEPPRRVCVTCSGVLLRQSTTGPTPGPVAAEPPTKLAILRELGRLLTVWGVTDWLGLCVESIWHEGKCVPTCRLQLEYEEAIALLATATPPDSAICKQRESRHWYWRWTGRVLGADLVLVALQTVPAPGISASSCASSFGLPQPPPDGAVRDFAEDVEDTESVNEEGARP